MNSALAALNRRFPNKRVFITGGAGSMGLAMARLLVEARWSVGIFDIDTAHLALAEATLGGLGPLLQAYPGDVTHMDEFTVAVNSFATTAGGLDVMVNCAGIGHQAPFAETELATWRELLETNVVGTVAGCRAALPHLLHNGRGVLLNVACATAFTSPPDASAFSASKAAIVAMTETLMAEFRATDIQVSIALPDMFGSEQHSSPTYTAERAARDILATAGKGRSHIVVPARARVLDLYKRLLPKQFSRRGR